MKKNTLIRTLVFGLTCLAASYGTAAEKPNVLVIYMDDMGWAQPGCYGGKMEPMLINLASDPGEQKDLSAKNPAKKQELQTLFDTWNASMKPPVREDLRWNGDEKRKANKKAKKQKK